jgi:hypothetical protein
VIIGVTSFACSTLANPGRRRFGRARNVPL